MTIKPLPALIAVALLQSNVSAAEGGFSDITWVPQIGVQIKNLEFEQRLKADTQLESGEGTLDVDLPMLSLGLTAVYKKFYVSVKYEDSFSDASAFSDVPNTDSETKVERTDYNIALGYNVFGSMNVFFGFLDGETKLNPQPLCPAFAPPGANFPPFPDCGDGGVGFPSLDGNKAQDNNVLELAEYIQTYEEKGWLFGASYVWRFDDMGSLSISAAYAKLEATYQDNWLAGSAEFANQPFAYDFEGDSDGLSIGINWSGFLTNHMGYYFDIRQQNYEMSATQSFAGRPDRPPVGSSQNQPQPIATRRVETEETITALTAGIQWYF